MGNHSSTRFNRTTSVAGQQPTEHHRPISLDPHSHRDKSLSHSHRHKSDADSYFDYTSSSGGSKKTSSMYSSHYHNSAREHKRHGVVSLKVVNQHTATANLRGAENHICHTITPKGSIIYGTSNFNPAAIQDAFVNSSSGYQLLPPDSFTLLDNRAHKVLVSYCNGWHVIPFPEVFSRHSGTCLVLGDRANTSPPFHIKTGDCFRLGSVGLVVSELRGDDEEVHRLDNRTLEFLKDEALAFDSKGDIALSATEEIAQESGIHHHVGGEDDDDCPEDPCSPTYRKESTNGVGSGGIAPGERFVCYMCYENHDTEDDALVAPCDCKGDTRYLHVQCLQKWYQSTLSGQQAQVIRTTGNGSPACKICGAAYKTGFRKASGKIASILETDKPGPYLCLVVVTKHDTNPGLFNTKFRLNFQSEVDHQASFFNNPEESTFNSIVIGRSSVCNMVLDYRTVSTIHAKITYEDGKFYLKDRMSSNGTMVYLRDPFPLSYSSAVKLRMGRTTISLQAKRNWSSTVRNMFGPSLPSSGPHAPSPEVVQQVLFNCMTDASKAVDLPPLSHINAASSCNTLTSFRTLNEDNYDLHSDAPYSINSRRSASMLVSSNNSSFAASRPVSSHSPSHQASMRSLHMAIPVSATTAADEVSAFEQSDEDRGHHYNNRVNQHIHALTNKLSDHLMDLEELLAAEVSPSSIGGHDYESADSHRNSNIDQDHHYHNNNIITSNIVNNSSSTSGSSVGEHIHIDCNDDDVASNMTPARINQRRVSSPCTPVMHHHTGRDTLVMLDDVEEDTIINNNTMKGGCSSDSHQSPQHMGVLRSQSAQSRSSTPSLGHHPIGGALSSSVGNNINNMLTPDLASSLSSTLLTHSGNGSYSTLLEADMVDYDTMHYPSNSRPSCRVTDSSGSHLSPSSIISDATADDVLYTSFPTAGAFTAYGQQIRSVAHKNIADSDS